MRAFGIDELKQIVQLAGQELEREDRYIAGCFARNPAYRDQVHGIYCVWNERYFQHLTQKALFSRYPFRVRLEHNRFDIALFPDTGEDPLALGQMKLWGASRGEAEIPSIMDDIRKLAPQQCGQFLMVFTISPKGSTEENVKWLAEKLKCAGKPIGLYMFDTLSPHADGKLYDAEFAVIGILVRENEAAA